VRFASRYPDDLEHLVKGVGENASIGTIKEAARFGEWLSFAVPFDAWPALAKEIGQEIWGEGRGGCWQLVSRSRPCLTLKLSARGPKPLL
jgi:hypothetical protein